MPRAFDITSVTDSVRLDARGQGEVAFTVSNALRAPVRARASVVPGPGMDAAWTTIEGGEERDFTPDGTQQFTVQMKVPPGTPPGRHTFHLLVVDVSNPDERYAEGPATAFEVVAAAAPPPKPFPWPLVVLVAGVCVITVGVVLIVQSHGTGGSGSAGLLEACADEEACAKDLVCMNADGGVLGGGGDGGVDGGGADGGLVGVCLGEKGFAPCDGGTQCSTGFCGGKGTCDLALGLICSANGFCPGPLKCTTVPGTSLCLLKPGEDCDSDRDCASFFCRNGKCNRDDGRCDTNDECRQPAQCSPTKLCQLPDGQPCTSSVACLSGFCAGTCQVAPVSFQCPFPCGIYMACINGQCIPMNTGPFLNQQMLRAAPDTLQGIQQLQQQQQQQQLR